MIRRRKHTAPLPRNGHHNRPPQPRRSGRGRFVLVKLVFIMLFAVIVGRLFQIQVLDGPEHRAVAKRQYEAQTELPASRGLVYDRNGNILISNTQFVSFAVDPLVVGDDSQRIARTFATVFGRPTSYYLQRIHSGRRFAWLERRVSPDYLERIHVRNFDGLIVINEPKRLYHYGDLGRDVLGETNIDNAGIAGLELQFDTKLAGRNGYMIMQRDGLMRTYPSIDYPRVEPVNGNNLILTLDLSLQAIAEEELKRGIERSSAESGLVVMMNPKTGAILAMADFSSDDRNRVVTDMFEPGSVFKIVTVAAAIDHTIRGGEDRFYAEDGEYRVQLPGNRVRVISDTEKYEWLTVRDAIKYSSNIVMAKMSDEIGAERFYKTSRDFGFGIATGIELPGEVRGDLKRPVDWSGTTLNTMAYGYEVGVTPLQMVSAYSAIANGGMLMKPFIVQQELNAQGKIVSETRPQAIRRVVGKATADTLVSFFEDVVREGTGRNAQVNGVRIAGKTGTARKYIDGKYSRSDHTASFVGFFPVEDPEIVCLVMMDNPRRGGYYASGSSAPVFRSIAERIISTGLLRVPAPRREVEPVAPAAVTKVVASIQQAQEQVDFSKPRVPDVRHYPAPIARSILHRSGYRVEAGGTGMVVEQTPSPGSRIEEGTTIRLVVAGPNGGDETITVPDLVGLTVRSALNRSVVDGLSLEVTGSGIVAQQIPRPGQQVTPGTIIRVQCRPRASAVQLASQ
jgi:cell division protein FtsI (penicillin-binding protein 3)